MANLEFWDTHNMVAYLNKSEGSEGFHQIVDFLNHSYISTLDSGEIQIAATIDGKVKIITEASIGGISRPNCSGRNLRFLSPDLLLRPLQQMRLHPQVWMSDMGGCLPPFISSLDAGQASGNIDKTPTMPHDSPLLRVHTLGSDEGKMQHNKLMDLVTKLSDIIVALETDLRQTKKVYGAAYTKLTYFYMFSSRVLYGVFA
ncbi:hypothetical protein Tco_0730313 [Tanacetum coccineum]|uniref:Uncharacterized protein n=1 Tax=Tanacetum coccineum TaxID=301880 RepID=A0ABQ4YSA5_9ASTR